MEKSDAPKPAEEKPANLKKDEPGTLDYIRKIGAATRERFSNLSWNGRLLVSIAAGIVAALLLFWIVDKVFYYYLVRSYVDQVADVFVINKHFANALVLLTFIAVVYLGKMIWSFSKRKRLIGIAGSRHSPPSTTARRCFLSKADWLRRCTAYSCRPLPTKA
jgi:hypothetical protein